MLNLQTKQWDRVIQVMCMQERIALYQMYQVKLGETKKTQKTIQDEIKTTSTTVYIFFWYWTLTLIFHNYSRYVHVTDMKIWTCACNQGSSVSRSIPLFWY